MELSSIRAALCACAILAATASAQTAGPSASPASLVFTYQVHGSVLPAAQTVQISVPAALAGSILTVQTVSAPQGWLTVTPDNGRAPLSLSVTVNPTGLSPGSYTGRIQVYSSLASANPAVVAVTLSITNPPSTLNVTSSATNFTTPPPVLTFSYTTGAGSASPSAADLLVSSTGDTIPFNVTAANGAGAGKGVAVWLRVSNGPQTASLKTSGVALSGSQVPITVSLDQVTLASLAPGSYAGAVAIAANSAVNGSATVAVNLVVSAGAPSVASVFPSTIVAGPVTDPVVTIYGDNFFSTSVVTLQQTGAAAAPVTIPSVLLSRKVLRATIPAATFPAASFATPQTWTLSVNNPAPPSNPSQAPATYSILVTSATDATISSVVNAASYMPTAAHTGSSPNPVPQGATSVSPREIISIFGQNLGPSTVVTASPSGTPPAFPTTLSGIRVAFSIAGSGATSYAPLVMVSSNQINAIVPTAMAAAVGVGGGLATVQVINSGAGVATAPFNIVVADADPGVFTFGGLGKGQAAVLNLDASGSYIINSAKDAAARGSTILIYVTGMGDLVGALADGEVAAGPVRLASATARVDIDGQPAVVSYAGAAGGLVAGLVQINAIVPPTVRAGQAIPLTVSVGSAAAARQSQPQVTIAVK